MRLFFCIVTTFIFLFTKNSFSQEYILDSFPEFPLDLILNDSIPIIFLDEVTVEGKMKIGKLKRIKRRRNKLIRNLKVVYPYAKLVGAKVNEINEVLPTLKTKKERKKYLNKEYRQLMKTYKKPLMRLRFSQGKLLFLLIDRETGHSSFYHIKELRGSMPAFLWQTLARVFGYNLKTKYLPNGKHAKIERIVVQIEQGKL